MSGASTEGRGMISALVRVAVSAVSAASVLLAQAPSKSIWVVGSQAVTQYDPASFTQITSAALPKQALEHPEYLSINARGQLLFVPPPGVEFGDGNITTVWFFDHGTKPPFARQEREDWPRAWLLAASGDGLYAFENRHATTPSKDGNDGSVRTTAQLMRKLLTETAMVTTVTLPALPLCRCTSGVCSESCPEWQVWAPGGVIGDFFLATKYIEGQLQSDIQETLLFRRAGERWQSTKLASPIATPLTASSNGQIIVNAVTDAGCCGWINESSDQLVVWRNGKSTVLFDEFTRYSNPNYDVTFSARRAELSPSGTLVAYTIAADRPSQSDAIRLSADGKDTPAELARVRRTIAALPVVEIVDLNQPTRPPVSIAKAEVVGWLDDTELVVVENGHIATYDARGAKRRTSAIDVRSGAYAFVR